MVWIRSRIIVLCASSIAVLALSFEECRGASKSVQLLSIKKTDSLRAMGALFIISQTSSQASNTVGILTLELGNYEIKTRNGGTVRYSGDLVLPVHAGGIANKEGMIQAKNGYLFCRVEVTATMSEGDSYNCLYNEVSLRANVDGQKEEFAVNGGGDNRTGFVIGRYIRFNRDAKKTKGKNDKKAPAAGDWPEKKAKGDERFKTTLVFIIPDNAKDFTVIYRGAQLKRR
jgi:hypothetical protein